MTQPVASPDPFAEANALREAQAREYGQWRAKHQIFIDGVRAFNAGDAVPASHVERGVVSQDDVEKVPTEAAPAAKKG